MADELEIKTSADLLKSLNDIKTGLETSIEEKAKATFDDKIKTVNEAIEALKAAKPEVTADELKAIKDDLNTTIKAFDLLQTRVKSTGGNAASQKNKTFNDILGDTIERYADQIKSYQKGNAPLVMDMMPEVKADKEGKREVKAVGDMSISANFANNSTLTTDIRTNLIETPYNRVWLGDLLPQGTTKGNSILYPKENGGEGGAGVWTRESNTDKPQMDFDFTAQSAYVKWLAGIVIIEREMLDDIDFLNAYIRNKMLISLKIAENDFILDGSTDTNPVQGLNDVATAYNGTYTNHVDRIIDAGWGQLVEGTQDFYNPTTTIVTPRDSVSIGLNKSAGSGEYNLPAGSVAFVNGQLQVGGIDVVKTTQIGTGNFLTFDKNATMFVKRMQPELRMFEDAALAKRNKIMFRVEERATLAIFNNAAIIKGTLAAA
jgi:hypothetical protein